MNDNQYLIQELVKDMKLEVVHMPQRKIVITNKNIYRPGLPLAGFFNHFESSRIQIIGKTEFNYIEQMNSAVREKRLSDFLEKHPKAVVYSYGQRPCPTMLRLAEKYEVPILSTSQETCAFMAAIIARLNYVLAPCITRHGVLVEVYGEGVLIIGDSGIGKSETAIELVKRGHRLIADDAVELRRVSDKTIVGSAPEMIRHYIELRGIGVIDVRQLFGMRTIKTEAQLDLIVHLEPWDQSKFYDRLGIEDHFTEIMDVRVPIVTIPVRPGRNLASIVEVATMNNRHRKFGFNAAATLAHQVDLRASSGGKQE